MPLVGAPLPGFIWRPILVLNVFTTNDYAPLHSGTWDAATVSRVKASEDDAFIRKLELSHLDLRVTNALLRWNLHQNTYQLLAMFSLTEDRPRSNASKKARQRFSKVPITVRDAMLHKIARIYGIYFTLRTKISALASKFSKCHGRVSSCNCWPSWSCSGCMCLQRYHLQSVTEDILWRSYVYLVVQGERSQST